MGRAIMKTNNGEPNVDTQPPRQSVDLDRQRASDGMPDQGRDGAVGDQQHGRDNGTAGREVSGDASILFQCFIPGIPQPGGSKKAFYIPKLKRAIITDDNSRAKDWKRTVSTFASDKYKDAPIRDAIAVEFVFVLPRPKGHYGSGAKVNTLRLSAPQWPMVKPDTTKLIRSTEDALSGIVWIDDNQIVDQHGSKVYGLKPGAIVTVRKMRVSQINIFSVQ